MKTLLLTILYIIVVEPSFAGTRAHFFNFDSQAMVSIANGSYEGGSDPDAELLYSLMDVPEQIGMIGKGKAIFTQEKDFSLTCALRGNKTECSLIVKKSPRVLISSSRQSIVVEIGGEEGARLASLFVKNNGEEFIFRNSAGTLELSAVTGGLLMRYKGE